MIELGMIAKDIITGFAGVVIIKTNYLSSVDRLSLQPRDLKEGKVRDSEDFDITQLEVTFKEKVIEAQTTEQKIFLGQNVICEVSGFKGTVFAVANFINGCRRIGVSPGTTKEFKIENNWIDEGNLIVNTNESRIKEGEKTTGGPAPKCNDPWR